MKQILKLIILFTIFCFFNKNVYAYNEEDLILDDKMYINPEWIEYYNLQENERINHEAIPAKYIYDFKPENNILKKYNSNNANFFSLYEGLYTKTYFNLANVDGKRYINSSNKNQNPLGLCWAFSALGSFESNIMLNGIKTKESCDINSTSKYCQNLKLYNNDQILNEYYINNSISCENGYCLDIEGNLITDSKGNPKKVVLDNATFSERYIDYIRSKPYTSNAYNNKNGQYTLISEQYNYYTDDDQIGSGGGFYDIGKFGGYGIAPVRTKGIWEKYSYSHKTYTLNEVFDSENVIYQLRNYYQFPTTPNRNNTNYENELKLWVEELKKNIVNYGSAYVGTGVPDNRYGSCFFDDTKNGVKLMNNTGNCGKYASHALQIIGWDDNYKFGYCKITKQKVYEDNTIPSTTTYTSSNSTGFDNKMNCETNKIISDTETKGVNIGKKYTETTKGVWTEGTGAWILKNSWGNSLLYSYLSYQSNISTVYGVREVGIKNFENNYNKKNSKYEIIESTIENGNTTINEVEFIYKKAKNKEYIKSFNITTSSTNEMSIFLHNGYEYEFITKIKADYPGMYTIDVDNFEVFNDNIKIKVQNANVSDINVFTINECTINNNCNENNKEIHSYVDTDYQLEGDYYPNDGVIFKIYSKTNNINSGTKLDYNVYNEDGINVTSDFKVNSNYVIKNANIGTLEFVGGVPKGIYKLSISSDNAIEEHYFNLSEKIKIEFEKDEYIFLDEGNKEIKAILSNVDGVGNHKWSSSDTNIATISQDGILTPLRSGMTNITYTIDTIYGSESKTEKIYIYEKIYNTNEFFNIYASGNEGKSYFLMNDLDFANVSFDAYKNTTTSFKGVFDGNNHVLSNIEKINYSTYYTGLFNMASNAIIRNFTLENSNFEGKGYVGSVVGYAAYNTKISNIYNYSNVKGQWYSGGITGYASNSYIEECFNVGNVETNFNDKTTYTGGIIGYSKNSEVKNCYNEGKIISKSNLSSTNDTLETYVGGIIATDNNSKIINSYNKGEIDINSPFKVYSNGLIARKTLETTNLNNSYYLSNNIYTINFEEFQKSEEELKNKETFKNWDFENIWYIRENKISPILRNYPVETEKIEFNIFSNILNNNYIYNYEYEVLPYTVSSDVIVYSEDEELFTIEDNKIITKNKIGTANIVFKVENKEFKYPITVKPIIEYSYGKGVTSEDVEVDLNINYYNENTDNSYLKLIYKVGNDTNIKEFNYGTMQNNFKFKIDNNNDIKLELYLCNNSCNLITEESFEINNIDKEKPEIIIESDNIKSTLKINVRDIGISGLSKDNKYEYAISNSNILAPMVFNTYIPDKEMNNIFMNHYLKYLWIRNISDNVGNKASLNDYIIYNLDIKNVDAEEVVVDIFSDILNYNKEYTFDYEVTPINITNDVIIESSNKELFEIKDNKIITKEKNGTANILFKIGKKEFKYPIIIKDSLEYTYDKNLTNRDISVKIHTNYFEGVLDEFEHLKLIYKIGEKEYVKEFDKNIATNEYEFVVNNNNNINLELYLCNEDCILVNNKNFDIKNIDKEKPIVNYVADNINGTLQINIKDIGVSGLNEKNIYKYAISNSDTRTPITSFKEYIPNTEMNNITMNKEYKYLWLYNIGDKVGNKVIDDDYIVYTIDLQAIYYNINYYNNDKSTLLKSEKIKEDDSVIINYKPNNYEDENYIYEFDYWDGFKEGMTANKDINLYAVYKKIPKELYSDMYIIKDGIIKNIKLNNINEEYSVDLFKSNLKYYESYSFYENNNAYISDVKNIKTGMKLKNNLYEYIIVLAGDVTGDGKVRMNDVMKIANHLVNKNVLNDEYLLAGDVTNDDNVKMNDVMKIASSLVNGGSL